MKRIDPELLKMMMRNHKLIASLRQRKFTATAIAKAVLAAEDSRNGKGDGNDAVQGD